MNTQHHSPLDLIDSICRTSPVIASVPAVEAANAAALAQALSDGGVTVMTVSVRTRALAKVIRAVGDQSGIIIGVRNVLSAEDARTAHRAGARFCVAPGASDTLLRYFDGIDMPLLPGAATVTEVIRLLDRGYTMQKFFPAEASGGLAALQAIGDAAPLVKFCACGGITAEKTQAYLGMPNVACVAADWIAPVDLIAAEKWGAIRKLAGTARELAP